MSDRDGIESTRDPCEHPECPHRPAGPAPPPILAPQQRQVVACLAAGMAAKEIGARLGLRVSTVRGYIRDAKRKLRYRSTKQLIAMAGANGWAPRDPRPTAETGAKPVDGPSPGAA